MSSPSLDNYKLLAQYNQWMNQKLYSCTAQLPPDKLKADLGAFFGSIFRTMNHLLFGDRFILTRLKSFFDKSPALASLAPQWDFEPTIEYRPDLDGLRDERIITDKMIIDFVNELDEQVLTQIHKIHDKEIPVWLHLTHLFNHQAHHRGQITTMLFQSGIDIGLTDINAFKFQLDEE